MKRGILLLTILVLISFFTSCTFVQKGDVQTEPESAAEVPQGVRLAIGILKLEEMGLPLDANQAQTLLTLWKVYRNLSTDDATAPQELAALETQIRETLSVEQRQVIDTLDLSAGNLMALVRDLLLPGGAEGARAGNADPSMRATRIAQRAAQMAGGNPRGPFVPGAGREGFAPPGERSLGDSGSIRFTMQAGFATRLYDAVISTLQAKVNG